MVTENKLNPVFLTIFLVLIFFCLPFILTQSLIFPFLGLIFLIFSIICFTLPFYSFMVFIFLALHTQVINQHVLGITVYNLLILLIGTGILNYYFIPSKYSNRQRNLSKKILLFFSYFLSLLVVSLFNQTEKYQSVVYYCLGVFFVLFIFLILVDSEKKLKIILNTLLISGFILISFGFFEILIGRTFFYSAWTLTERYRFGIIRMGSTVADPNFICLAIVPLIPVAWHFFIRTKKSWHKRCYFLVVIFFIMGTILTFSRVGYLVLIFIIFFLFRYNFVERFKSYLILRLSINLILILIIIGSIFGSYAYLTNKFTDAKESSNVRYQALLISFNNFQKHPFIGVGFNNLEETNALHIKSHLTTTGGISSMNTFLKILTENGLFTFLSFIIIAIITYFRMGYLEKYNQIYSYLKIGFLSWLLLAFTLDSMGTIILWIFIASSLMDKKTVEPLI